MSKSAELLTRYEEEIESIWRDMTPKSRELCDSAKRFTPGGAVRSHSTGTHLPYGDRVDGCHVYDVDGNKYIDLVLGMACVMGHNHPAIVAAIQEQIPKGLVTFKPDVKWDLLAEKMNQRVPSIDKVWPAFGGSQAFMWAIRAARAHTRRDKIVKIRGSYHGTYDDAFISPPHGSPGIPKDRLNNLLFVDWNDKEGTERVIRENKEDIAAVLTEGFHTGGALAPQDGYLSFLRETTEKYGIVLIFDEIVNFWLDHGGTGKLYDVEPDLCCYGKGIGGGIAMGMVGGRNEIMNLFNQEESYRIAAIAAHQGDPLTVSASLACLEIMSEDEIARINANGEYMAEGIRNALTTAGLQGFVSGYGNHQALHLTDRTDVYDPVTYFTNTNTPGLKEVMSLFRRSLINKGVMTLENLMHVRASIPLTKEEIDFSVKAIEETFREIRPILAETTPHLVI